MRAIIAVLSILTFSAFASDAPKALEPVNENNIQVVIKAKMKRLGLDVISIEKSPAKSIFQVFTKRGLFYFSDDGNYLLQGTMYNISDGAAINETDHALAKVRVEGMTEFKDSMIVFPAKDEKFKVTVFTDSTCGYCKKMHSQMQDYNDLGITVRYLAFPRSGPSGSTYEQMKAVWCATDQRKAITDVKAGQRLDTSKNMVCDMPIKEQYELGVMAGVTGTPSIMMDNGEMLPGYQPPEQLLETLKSTQVN